MYTKYNRPYEEVIQANDTNYEVPVFDFTKFNDVVTSCLPFSEMVLDAKIFVRR